MPEYLYIDGALRAVSVVGTEYSYVDGSLVATEGEAGNVIGVNDAIEFVSVTEYAQRFPSEGGVEQAELPLVWDAVLVGDRAITPLLVERVETVTVTEGAPELFALFIAQADDLVTVVDVIRASLGNLAASKVETIGVTDSVRLSTPNLSVNKYELVAVTEGPMNLSAAGIGIAPTPPPGSTLQDYWVVGIV